MVRLLYEVAYNWCLCDWSELRTMVLFFITCCYICEALFWDRKYYIDHHNNSKVWVKWDLPGKLWLMRAAESARPVTATWYSIEGKSSWALKSPEWLQCHHAVLIVSNIVLFTRSFRNYRISENHEWMHSLHIADKISLWIIWQKIIPDKNVAQNNWVHISKLIFEMYFHSYNQQWQTYLSWFK